MYLLTNNYTATVPLEISEKGKGEIGMISTYLGWYCSTLSLRIPEKRKGKRGKGEDFYLLRILLLHRPLEILRRGKGEGERGRISTCMGLYCSTLSLRVPEKRKGGGGGGG